MFSYLKYYSKNTYVFFRNVSPLTLPCTCSSFSRFVILSPFGLTFNDIQMIASRVQYDSFSILLRFRQHAFVFIADVEKICRRVYIASSKW